MENKIFDLAVIGGGIAGGAIAREATIRGKSVILFEKNTYGSGTSSKSSKLIHGGLRYLETAWSALLSGHPKEFFVNLRFVFLALGETHRLAHDWPELVKEIELLMPAYKFHGRSRFAVYFGTWFYGLLSVLGGGKKGTKILWNANDILKLEPNLNPKGLIGGALVQDHTTDDLALVRAIIADAKTKGVEAHEHAQVVEYQFDAPSSTYRIKVKLYDKETVYHARHLVNASGAWADQVREKAGKQKSDMVVPIAGAHVEVPVFSNYSIILQAEDKRIFFVINRGDKARIGTTERLHLDPDRVIATPEEVHYLLRGVKTFFPKANLATKDVLIADAGIRPLAKPAHAVSANQISREHRFIRDEMGVMHVIGVKLTDHRRAACELLDKLK